MILTIAIAAAVHWRHPLWRPVSLRWHQVQLERAYRAAVSMSLPNNRLAVDLMNQNAPHVDRGWLQAWQRMAQEYDAVQTAQGFLARATAVYWNISPATPLLIAPMKTS